MILIVSLLALSIAVNVIVTVICSRFVRLSLEFDDLFEMLSREINNNVDYLKKLTSMPVMVNSPEILDAQKKMHIMRIRLEEYVRQMGELTRRKLAKEKKTNPNPPVVA